MIDLEIKLFEETVGVDKVDAAERLLALEVFDDLNPFKLVFFAEPDEAGCDFFAAAFCLDCHQNLLIAAQAEIDFPALFCAQVFKVEPVAETVVTGQNMLEQAYGEMIFEFCPDVADYLMPD